MEDIKETQILLMALAYYYLDLAIATNNEYYLCYFFIISTNLPIKNDKYTNFFQTLLTVNSRLSVN
jgi:hypothetical protein